MRDPQLWYASPDRQAAFQAAALSGLLHYVQQNSPFYNTTLRGIGPDTVLQELPFTTKEDLQQHPDDFLCVPLESIREYTATSGTLGRPVTIALTASDLQRLAYNEAQSFRLIGAGPADVIQLLLTLDRQFMAGMAYYSGVQELGAAVIRTGPGLPQMQWEVAERLHTTAFVAVPSFLLQLAELKMAHGTQLPLLRRAMLIGEGIRQQDFTLNPLGRAVAESWPGLNLHSTYAATELQTAFTECSAGQGGHHQPDLCIVEIIDSETLKPLPDGVPGEVVVTTLGIQGMPLIRYRTGDVATLHAEPCSCGRLSKRLGPVLGRQRQMIKYRGTTLYPQAIFNLLQGAPCVDDYVVEAFSNDLGTDELSLHLLTQLTPDDCAAQLRPLLQSQLRVIPQLIFRTRADLAALQMPEGSRKLSRFSDRRNPKPL